MKKQSGPQYFMKWRWVSDWFLLAAVGVFIVVSLIFFLKQETGQNSARYILSTIPQIIGTVFVLTVAVMQAVGGSDLMPAGKLVLRLDFRIVATVSFVGVVAPLIVLYLDLFWIGTALCLGWGAGNLFVIFWFIWRFAPEQAAAKLLSELKDKALERLVREEEKLVCQALGKIAEIAQREFKHQPYITHQACTIIKDVLTSWDNGLYNVWQCGAKFLVEIDKVVRGEGGFNFSENVILKLMSEIALYETAYGSTGSAACNEIIPYTQGLKSS